MIFNHGCIDDKFKVGAILVKYQENLDLPETTYISNILLKYIIINNWWFYL